MEIVQLSYKLSSANDQACLSLLSKIGWTKEQIEGQLKAMTELAQDTNSLVLLAFEKDELLGYISAQFYSWNALGQIHGLVIDPLHRKKGIARTLVKAVEIFLKTKKARGVYVDTPINNISGCRFYEKMGFSKAYVIPEYYAKGLDGVAFQKFWGEPESGY